MLATSFGLNRPSSGQYLQNLKMLVDIMLLINIMRSHLRSLLFFTINPLMPELNLFEQRCLPGFFTGDFTFYFLVLKKKANHIDFSFKFNEIQFCIMLMNWLICKNMFTYF
jgi:hypothetical protein